jgi:mono/diheme cytochrome c family protein
MKRVLALLVFTLSCNDRQVFHDPDPTLARMMDQRRADTWEPNVMREPPADTVARDDDADEPPPPVTRALLVEGRRHFEIVCATCHGMLGDGHSVVASKMQQRPPPSLHDARAKALTPAQLYSVITNGYGLMPSLAANLTRHERWAVIAYIDALRVSQAASVAELPPDVRDALGKKAQP